MVTVRGLMVLGQKGRLYFSSITDEGPKPPTDPYELMVKEFIEPKVRPRTTK